MQRKHSSLSLIASVSVMAMISGTASSAVIVNIPVDTPSDFLSHAIDAAPPILPIVHDVNPGPYGVHWRVTLSVFTFTQNIFAPDVIDISGTVRHVIPPHGEGPGIPFVFAFSGVSFAGPNVGGFPWVLTQTGVLAHGDHRDDYTINLFVTCGAGGNITHYDLEVIGHHVPGPAALSLLGFAGLVSPRRRVRGE